MTTGTELRDLLAAEAGGPIPEPSGWDDVVRRGRHRRQVRRVQSLAILVFVVGAATVAISQFGDDATVDTTPATTAPAPTVQDIDPSTILHGVAISRARTEGASLRLFFPDLNPCKLRPLVVESEAQIGVALVGQRDPRGAPWAACENARDDDPSSTLSWATISLGDRVADRPVVNLSTDQTVAVTDGADLLFPTSLPAPFDVDVYVEPDDLFGEAGEGWIFRFTAEAPQYVHLSSSTDLESNGSGCDGRVVGVRGTEGCYALNPPSLAWDERGRAFYLSMISVEVEGDYLDDLLAIAEGLEPLDG